MDKLEKASAELKQASLPYRAQTRNSSLEKLSFFELFQLFRNGPNLVFANEYSEPLEHNLAAENAACQKFRKTVVFLNYCISAISGKMVSP